MELGFINNHLSSHKIALPAELSRMCKNSFMCKNGDSNIIYSI